MSGDFNHGREQHRAYRDQVWARRDEQASSKGGSGGSGGGGGGLCSLTVVALFGGFVALCYTAGHLVQALAAGWPS